MLSSEIIEIDDDLKYWGDKLKYAEEHMWGEKGENVKKVSRMMLDLYLDWRLKEGN